MDNTEFVRICQEELRRAHAYAGTANLPTNEILYSICEDMWLGLPKQIKPSMLKDLFRVARANYAKIPDINALRKAWDNHMKPNEMPAPADAPRLPAPEITNDAARWRKLAAVRTALAEGWYLKNMVAKKKEETDKKSNDKKGIVLTAESRLGDMINNDLIGEAYRPLGGEEWMKPYLKEPPCVEEAREFVFAVVGIHNDRTRLEFYLRRKDVAPFWGKYIEEYGL